RGARILSSSMLVSAANRWFGFYGLGQLTFTGHTVPGERTPKWGPRHSSSTGSAPLPIVPWCEIACPLVHSLLHPHYLVAAIDVDGLSGNGRSALSGEEQAGCPEFVRQNVALQRRVCFVVFQHLHETGDPTGSECVHGAGADAIDADFLRAKVVSQVACA